MVAAFIWAVHFAVYSSAGITIEEPNVIAAMGTIFKASE
jgi:hypothetical protein